MAKEQIPDLSALVVRAQKGDTEAFGQIYDALVKPVYRYIYYRVDAQIAEDLTEETFLKVWQNLKKYKKGKHPFSSWVFKIAHNLVCDYYRKHQTTSEIDENIPDPQDTMHPERKITIKFTQIQLRKAITKLPENFQQVIILKRCHSYNSIPGTEAVTFYFGRKKTRFLKQKSTFYVIYSGKAHIDKLSKINFPHKHTSVYERSGKSTERTSKNISQ
jgi:RNA polymerase sigma-70 factor (ECF subfamily)